MLSSKINLRGQIGETLTWLVATILIIILLIFFIFGASLLGGTKKIGGFRKSLTSGQTFEGGDIFLKKSLFTYVSLNSESKRIIVDKSLAKSAEKGAFDLDYEETKKEILLRYSKK